MNLRQTTNILVFGLLLASTALPLPAAPRDCEALRQWALDNKATLPNDFAGLSALPTAERRAVYGVLTAEEKADYWRGRVAAYLDANADLSAAQVHAIWTTAAALRPEVFGPQNSNGDLLAEVAQEAHAALGETIVQELFYGLGPADSSDKPEILGSRAVQANCNCKTLAECSPPEWDVCVVGNICTRVSGCGFVGWQDCIGLCGKISDPSLSGD